MANDTSPTALGLTPVNKDGTVADDASPPSLGLTPVPPPSQTDDTPTDAGTLAGAGHAVLRGLKQALAPHLLNKEDIDGKHTLAETGIETATNIGADIGTSYITAAAAGSVFGPEGTVIAPLMLALYRGFGYEKAKADADHEDFSWGRAALNTAANVNPLLGKGGKLAKAATQGVLEAGRAAAYGADAEGTAVSGVVGGAVAGLLHHQTAGWFAVAGDAMSRPTSPTDHPGASGDTVSDLAQTFVSKARTDIVPRAEKLEQEALAEDPGFYKLADKLDKYADARSTFDQELEQIGEGIGAKVPGIKTSKLDDEGFRRSATDRQLDKMGSRYGIDDLAASLSPEAAEAKKLVDDVDGFRGFAKRMLGGKKASDVDDLLQHYGDARGPEALDDLYASYKKQTLLVEAADGYNRDIANGISDGVKLPGGEKGQPKDPLVSPLVTRFSDLKYVMRKIDDTLGTDFEGMAMDFVEAKNRQSVAMMPYMKEAQRLYTMGRKAGVTNEEIGKHLAAAEEGAAATLTGDKKEVADGWAALFEKVRQRLNDEGLKVDFAAGSDGAPLASFLPRSELKGVDGATALRKEMERVQDLHPGNSDWLGTKDAVPLRRAVGKQLGMDGIDAVQQPNQVRTVINNLLQADGYKASTGARQASATFQRETELIPGFMRNYDVGDVFTNYMNTNFKSVFYNDAFVNMKSNLAVADAMGFKKSSAYINQFLTDMSGNRSDQLASVQTMINKYKYALDKMSDAGAAADASLGERVQGKVADFAQGFNNFASWAVGSIYPNYMGWNIRSAVRDSIKPFVMTAPELGGTYGLNLASKAYYETAAQRLTGKLDFEEFLQQRGLGAGLHNGEATNITSDALRGTPVVGKAVELSDKINNLSMYTYSKVDALNRVIAYKVGEKLAADVQRGVPEATAFIENRLSEGAKTRVRQLLADGQVDQMGDVLGKYLVSKTQFDYGKEAMNEFGREYGRLFSMFTKWPAAVMSDSMEMLRRGGDRDGALGVAKGVGQAALKYVAPLAALSFAGNHLLDLKEGGNPYERLLIGDDLGDFAPIKTIQLRAPPLVQTGLDALKVGFDAFKADKAEAATTGDAVAQKASEAGKLATNFATTFLPSAFTPMYNEYARYKKAFGKE